MEKQYIVTVIAAAVFAALSTGCGSEGEKQNAEQGLSTQTLIMQDETVVLPAVPYESTETTDSRDSVTNGSYVTMYKLPDEDACRIEEMGGTEATKSYRIFYDETVADDGHRYGYFGITYAVNTYGADDESMRYGIISQHEEHWDEDNYVYPKQECCRRDYIIYTGTRVKSEIRDKNRWKKSCIGDKLEPGKELVKACMSCL